MKVIKAINNNVAVCVDSKGRELIAFGKGIGFGKAPYELKDMKKINRTFYDLKPEYYDMITELPMDIIEFSAEIIDEISLLLPYQISPNAFLTLADHITFSIEREKKKMYFNMPLSYEIQELYPKEIKIARKIIKEIEKRFSVKLNDSEVVGIALNIVNSGTINKIDFQSNSIEREQEKIIKQITKIIERELHITVNKDSFNYTRFSSHLVHLLKRLNLEKPLDSQNDGLYKHAREDFPAISKCVDDIAIYLYDSYHCILDDEEKLYLIMHINRVCTNEGCNLTGITFDE